MIKVKFKSGAQCPQIMSWSWDQVLVSWSQDQDQDWTFISRPRLLPATWD